VTCETVACIPLSEHSYWVTHVRPGSHTALLQVSTYPWGCRIALRPLQSVRSVPSNRGNTGDLISGRRPKHPSLASRLYLLRRVPHRFAPFAKRALRAIQSRHHRRPDFRSPSETSQPSLEALPNFVASPALRAFLSSHSSLATSHCNPINLLQFLRRELPIYRLHVFLELLRPRRPGDDARIHRIHCQPTER
jgi:hypothetical protein